MTALNLPEHLHYLIETSREYKYNRLKAEPFTPTEVNWRPFPDSPQERAYHCTANVIGYGGAAGGAKTDLLLGKALTLFQRAVIYRLHHPDLQDIIERGDAILNGQAFFVRGEKRRWELPDGRFCMATS